MCGTASMPALQVKPDPEDVEKPPTQGAFSGLLFGLLAVPLLVIVGTMLCLTGLGAILGIPMILTAVFAPLLGSLIGMDAHRGKCPWCGAAISNMDSAHHPVCPVCNKEFAVKHHLFIKAA